jgi:tRNA threonylcarbamoyladenosine biosynthesis protein TsaE
MTEFLSASPEETAALGERLGRACRGGEVLFLHGPLGAGKTCLLQGLARGLEVPDGYEVVSPTFVLHCQYPGRLAFDHIDAYRLRDAGDVDGLGFEELFGDAGRVCAVEWAEYLADLAPPERLEIHLDPLEETRRRLRFVPVPGGAGQAHAPWAERLLGAAEGGDAADQLSSEIEA